ncbi:hypothetical protein O6H91_01G162600 [Diphasiastrum complanatum]|uniref:Uncharacterized protein n=1 Tax=Diphasiastrum complanatum TaxID=34168 RepID=A0ACC2EY79_DIPCM|nr:hypothetical protein O6H91_Y107000 [Diphasiastrum complanatum]KAJ7571419.1 hypothetical protein O6H91_01G162600 [Diphasiastrum complanatum]
MESASFEKNTSSLSGKVDESRVGKAVDALLKWMSHKTNGKPQQLLEDDQLLYLVISLKKIPERERTNPYRIPLPHPLFSLNGSQEVCLIVNDREKGINKKEAKQKILQEGLGIAKVVGITKLKTDFFSFEAKRKLCGSYDLFLADDRILPRLPALLGKAFFKKKKHPIPVKLSRAQWKNQVEAACGSTFLYIRGGTCSMLKAARISQTRQEIMDNIMAAIQGAAEAVPKKWRNIRAIHLKTMESLALPLYQAMPDTPFKIESGLLQPATEARNAKLEPGNDPRKNSKKKSRKRYIDTE